MAPRLTPSPAAWDQHYLGVALNAARYSKDPATRVGAVIVSPRRRVWGAGYNRFPTSIKETPERMNDRDVKLSLVIHAELNAVFDAQRSDRTAFGCTLYLACTDDSGDVWGGPPCTRCTVHLIEAGIAEIVSHPIKATPSKWHADLAVARELLAEAGVKYREVAL